MYRAHGQEVKELEALISKPPKFVLVPKSAYVASAGPTVVAPRGIVWNGHACCIAKLCVAASCFRLGIVKAEPGNERYNDFSRVQASSQFRLAHPNALCMRISQSHNSSSSSILDSMVVVGMVPSEFPRSFCAPKRAWPKLLRTFSSKPGKEARCFLNGDAMLLSASAVAVADADPSAFELPGAGEPEAGDPDEDSPAGGPCRGSAECCRFS